jgi:outer membrane lipoprotein-sorting protein
MSQIVPAGAFMRIAVLLLTLGCVGHASLGAQATNTASPEQSSCSLLTPQPKPISAVNDAVLLDVYNTQVSLIRSLHATALLRGLVGGEYRVGERPREFPAIIDFARPNLIRMTGVLPFAGSRGFEMASDGQMFRLLVPEDGKKTFLVGRVDAPAHSQKPRENLRPQPLIDALTWEKGTPLASAKAKLSTADDTQTLQVDLPPSRSGPSRAAIEFDLRSGVVKSLSTYDSSGHLLSEIGYQDWKKMSTYPEGAPVGCFPRHIHLVQLARDFEIDIRITDIALNPEIPKYTFRPSPPKGIPIVTLDMLGNPVDH